MYAHFDQELIVPYTLGEWLPVYCKLWTITYLPVQPLIIYSFFSKRGCINWYHSHVWDIQVIPPAPPHHLCHMREWYSGFSVWVPITYCTLQSYIHTCDCSIKMVVSGAKYHQIWIELNILTILLPSVSSSPPNHFLHVHCVVAYPAAAVIAYDYNTVSL